MTKYTKLQLLNAYCAVRNYQEQIPVLVDGEQTFDDEGVLITEANPESKIEFLKRTEREMSLNTAVSYLEHVAKQDLMTSIEDKKVGITLD